MSFIFFSFRPLRNPVPANAMVETAEDGLLSVLPFRGLVFPVWNWQ
jgi:hypothetical protein